MVDRQLVVVDPHEDEREGREIAYFRRASSPTVIQGRGIGRCLGLILYLPYTREGGIGNLPLPVPKELKDSQFPILEKSIGYITPSERRKFNALIMATTVPMDGIRPVNDVLELYQNTCRTLAEYILRRHGFNRIETEFAPPNSITYATLRTLTGEVELTMIDRFENRTKNAYLLL